MSGDQDRRIREAETELDQIGHDISEAKDAAQEALPDRRGPAEGGAEAAEETSG
ncbi:hypothetical protein [Amycolatopsis sp. PS_44_ISF1]|uniref:hypothetical protein n=1 Tax=Amycolatopsis sp. PS_44_ISF1 TaxID=2974917 RepID=UPI0028DDCDBE|nr:hypothetical protein [Amycolatopsis sp. PS_44_ISF1]MDT8913838.1 hypothetical protein [Amycolatopsis sp. PS_44_ISF1]